MSGEGIGEAVAMVLFGAGAAVWYGLKGAAWLTYHGVKGIANLTVGAGKAIHAAYVANEARRREKALKELEAIEGVMARSTESLLKDIRKAEEESEKLRAKKIAEIEEKWDASLNALDREDEDAAAAFRDLHDFHTKSASELTTSLTMAVDELEEKLNANCNTMCESTMRSVESASLEMERQLEKAELTIEERNAQYMEYAQRSLKEAEAMLKWIEANYDSTRFATIGIDLAAAKAKVKSVREAIKKGAAKGAASNATAAVSAVQMLAARAESITARFNRKKAEVDEAIADLKKTVESSRVLMPEEESEELREFVTEDLDADFWSEGRLKEIWEEAEKLEEEASLLCPEDNSVALVQKIRHLKVKLMQEYTRTRMHILGKNEVVKLSEMVVASHEENGWKLVEDPSYVEDDIRNDMRLRFEKNGDTRVVFVKNTYNPNTGLYEQRLLRYADEAGMPDEEEREREDKAISGSMSELDVDSRLHMTCDKTTAGEKRSAN